MWIKGEYEELIGTLAPMKGLKRNGFDIPHAVTWYLNDPTEVWMKRVLLTVPSCLARNTISKEVFSFGKMIWNQSTIISILHVQLYMNILYLGKMSNENALCSLRLTTFECYFYHVNSSQQHVGP